ncbi:MULTISPECIES: AraC family transcriptional regulator [unclassified Myroides]|uniref:helix-turn-helix domain-containing protein n=1 Tax=unclassified Myroides TaxID=2642485 RepID=UPI0015FA6213|nr:MULTISPECIES: AraC family transcriptional regulator [unclassified Myroides]MBB1150200.1 helix-turn-helix transcriptional regulator [Myroides sp. NP-2]MDM1407287.1 helix-turn-helix transcriptional regulator [Myroides sp. DF42-4-2]
MEVLYIKNMVCHRCTLMVQNEIEALGLKSTSIKLGEVELEQELSTAQRIALTQRLEALGFALIDDKKSQLIAQIKTTIVELVHYQNNELQMNLSDYLSQKLGHDYNYLSSLFSEVEGKTIEKYFIAQKIEKIKELLVYDELSLSEIAHRLNYSSVAYLSNQFKKVTGLTPSYFKKIRDNKRKPLDEV